MNNNISINIEKAVLSSILFNPEDFEKIKEILQADDFFSSTHQEIFKVMKQLYSEEMPIVEEFILKRLNNSKLNHALIDILSANPISNALTYVKEIKKDSLTKQIQQLSAKLQHNFDLSLIDKISTLKNELEDLNFMRKLRNIDEVKNFFNNLDIDFEEINNIKIGYLIDNFLVKNEITMISALPSTGKSLISVATCNMLLIEQKINYVFYIDGDNSKATIKERNIHHLKNAFDSRFKYFVGLSKSELLKIIEKLQQLNLIDSLVVFDSIKNFIVGDRDKNKDVSSGMETLKKLRNNGATVIFLHHTNKNLEADYAGSSAFLEDTSNAFILKKNHDKNAFILKPFKARTGDLHELAFKYLDNHTLIKLDLDFAKETNEEVEIRDDIIDFISNARDEVTYSEILNHLMSNGYPKMKSNDILKAGKDKFWGSKKIKQYNKTIFFLIEQTNNFNKAIEIVFENELLKAS
jgi:replicative DNA helicase